MTDGSAVVIAVIILIIAFDLGFVAGAYWSTHDIFE